MNNPFARVFQIITMLMAVFLVFCGLYLLPPLRWFIDGVSYWVSLVIMHSFSTDITWVLNNLGIYIPVMVTLAYLGFTPSPLNHRKFMMAAAVLGILLVGMWVMGQVGGFEWV